MHLPRINEPPLHHSPHVVETVSAGWARAPGSTPRLIHISMQMRRCKFKLIGNWATSALLAGKRRKTLSACVSDARRAADGLLAGCWRMQFPCSIYGWCAHFHPGIFHIYCALCTVYHKLLSRPTGAGDWRVFIFFFAILSVYIRRRLPQWWQFSIYSSGGLKS